MKKTGMLTTLTLLAAGLLLSPPASANERDARYEAPSPDFVLVTTLTWTDKDPEMNNDDGTPRKVIMQQWESEAQDVFILRTFSPNSFTSGAAEEYKRTYRGDEVWKPRPQYQSWDWYWPEGTFGPSSNFELVDPRFDFRHDGFSLRFKRSNFKAGKYTVLFTDRMFSAAQWKCSVYYKEVCRWSDGWETVTWDAYTFDVKKRTISKLREKGDYAGSPKQFQKQLTKVLNRK